MRHCARQRGREAAGGSSCFWCLSDFPMAAAGLRFRQRKSEPRGQPGTARLAAPCFRLATGPRSAPPAAESRGHSPPHQRRARQGRQRSQGESQAKPRSVRRRFGGCRRRCRRGVPGHGAWRVRPAAWPGLLRGPSRALAGWGKPPWAQPSRSPPAYPRWIPSKKFCTSRDASRNVPAAGTTEEFEMVLRGAKSSRSRNGQRRSLRELVARPLLLGFRIRLDRNRA